MVDPAQLAPGDLLTAPQTLAILPVRRSTLYRLVEEGLLPSHRVSTTGSRRGRILIERRDLETLIASSRVTRPKATVRVDVDDLLKRVRRQSNVAPDGKRRRA